MSGEPWVLLHTLSRLQVLEVSSSEVEEQLTWPSHLPFLQTLVAASTGTTTDPGWKGTSKPAPRCSLTSQEYLSTLPGL